LHKQPIPAWDWLKQQKSFDGCFGLNKSFETVLFQLRFSFVSVLFQLCGQLKTKQKPYRMKNHNKLSFCIKFVNEELEYYDVWVGINALQ